MNSIILHALFCHIYIVGIANTFDITNPNKTLVNSNGVVKISL